MNFGLAAKFRQKSPLRPTSWPRENLLLKMLRSESRRLWKIRGLRDGFACYRENATSRLNLVRLQVGKIYDRSTVDLKARNSEVWTQDVKHRASHFVASAAVGKKLTMQIAREKSNFVGVGGVGKMTSWISSGKLKPQIARSVCICLEITKRSEHERRWEEDSDLKSIPSWFLMRGQTRMLVWGGRLPWLRFKWNV